MTAKAAALPAGACRYRFDELPVGASFHHGYTVTPDINERFTTLFEDFSPLHVNDDVARSSGFRQRVVHGATLNGFLSHFVGMKCPGPGALLLEVSIKYSKPTYTGDELLLTATIEESFESLRLVTLKFAFTRDRETVARGRARVMIVDIP